MLEEDIEVMRKLFDKDNPMRCPKCEYSLIVIDLSPTYGPHGMIRNTYLECPKCGFKRRVNSYTIYGAVREYSKETVEIGSWSEIGGREVNIFRHILSENLLKELKETQDLVEFLIVDNVVIAVIG